MSTAGLGGESPAAGDGLERRAARPAGHDGAALERAGDGLAQLEAASTPPVPPWDPTRSHSPGGIRAGGSLWQFGRAGKAEREKWAQGVGGGRRCERCTAPLTWERGELECYGCLHSSLPLPWRRRCTELWLEGLEASLIAAQLKSTKNAVLSYRRRAHLPSRGSPLGSLPLGRAAQRAAAKAARIAGATPDRIIRKKICKPLPVPKPPKQPKRAAAVASPSSAPTRRDGTAEIGPSQRARGVAPRVPGFTTCQYITGRRMFCGDAVQPMSPYCREHTQLCYQKAAA